MKKQSIALFFVIFSVVILSACESKQISNEFISVNQYIGLKVALPDDKEDEQDIEEFESQIWNALLDNCTMTEFPQDELATLLEKIETQYGYVTYFDNKEVSDVIEELHGMTIEEFAKEQLKKQYAIELIAEEEDLQLSDKEYTRELEKRAREKGVDDVKEYENMFGRETLYRTLLEERVLEFIKDNLK